MVHVKGLGLRVDGVHQQATKPEDLRRVHAAQHGITKHCCTEPLAMPAAVHRQSAQHGLIEWSAELRLVINEALAVQRNKLAGTWYVFGNMQGQRYTKGGWKKTLSELMKQCVTRAAQEGQPFMPFSLQDCRPKGVSDKLARGDLDVLDATLHTSKRMVRSVYDRRRTRVAKPAP